MFSISTKTRVAIASGMAAVFWPVQVEAGTFHDLSAIDRAVAQFTGHEPREPGGARIPVDRQLRLTQCLLPLQLEYHGSARDAVRVTCPEQGSWRIFVPLQGEGHDGSAPAVLRRDVLRVEATGAGFRIVRQGEALQHGRVGEAIRVRLDDGTQQGKVISARVLEAGRVEAASN